MKKNKIFNMTLILTLLCTIFPTNVIGAVESYKPQPGDTKVVEIEWSRTTEPVGPKKLPGAAWVWSDVENINYAENDDYNVWDGGTIGNSYIQDAKREWDIATWKSGMSVWNGTVMARRFHGEFSIPYGYNAYDEVMISSVGDYSSLGLDDIIAINDNIYIFVYPKGEAINDDNFLQYLAFWTGTICQDAVTSWNGGVPITFHGILGTTPIDYKTQIRVDGKFPTKMPKENILSHTDGWYCEATEDNLGIIMQNYPESTEFVIDIIVEDYAGDGGMDRPILTFTKILEEEDITEEETTEITTEETTEETEEETTIDETDENTTELTTDETTTDEKTTEESTTEATTEPNIEETTKSDEEETIETELVENEKSNSNKNPKTGDTGLLPYFYALGASLLGIYYLLRKMKHF